MNDVAFAGEAPVPVARNRELELAATTTAVLVWRLVFVFVVFPSTTACVDWVMTAPAAASVDVAIADAPFEIMMIMEFVICASDV